MAEDGGGGGGGVLGRVAEVPSAPPNARRTANDDDFLALNKALRACRSCRLVKGVHQVRSLFKRGKGLLVANRQTDRRSHALAPRAARPRARPRRARPAACVWGGAADSEPTKINARPTDKKKPTKKNDTVLRARVRQLPLFEPGGGPAEDQHVHHGQL